MEKQKKPMNKFILLPIFLGVTCLVAGGLLAGVVFLTDPVIEQAKKERLAQGFKKMYKDDNATVLEQKEITDSEYFTSISKVNHSEKLSYVYLCKSTSQYEIMTFYVGFNSETQKVDGYYFLESSVSSLGAGKFKNNKSVTGLYKDYDGSGNSIISGVTFTSKAVQESVNQALNDFKTRDWSDSTQGEE